MFVKKKVKIETHNSRFISSAIVTPLGRDTETRSTAAGGRQYPYTSEHHESCQIGIRTRKGRSYNAEQ